MKLTKIFAFALAALAFVGCGNDSTDNGGTPSKPASGNINLKADKTAVQIGEEVTFTVTDINGNDVTADALIYEAKSLEECENATFSSDKAGSYSFFATYGRENSNYVTVKVLAEMPEFPTDSDPANLVFKHRPVLIDHTGVNCGFCPEATDNIHSLANSKEWKDKFNEVTCHGGTYAPMGSDPGASAVAQLLNAFHSKYISGYPTIIFNLHSNVNGRSVSAMRTVLNSIYKEEGADVGIALNVTGDDTNLLCAATIKSAVTQEYWVNAWLLESDIWSPNQSGGKTAAHKTYNYALRNVAEEV